MAKRASREKLGLTAPAVEPETQLTPLQKLVIDYQNTFGSESGGRVLEDLVKRFQKRRSYVPDSNATAFHEGQRDVVRMIENFLEADAQATIVIEEDQDQNG
jgi:hypothetical protein